jgi:hypothetical protein
MTHSRRVSGRSTAGLVGLLLLASCEPDAGAEVDYPSDAVVKKLRGLLAGGQYADLETRLAAYDAAAPGNPACEALVWSAYEMLTEGSPNVRALIDRWVSQRPDSAAPLVARTAMHCHMGHAARGYKFANETSEAQFAAMRKHFEQGIRDAVASRERGARAKIARAYLAKSL